MVEVLKGSDYTTIQAVLSKVKAMAYPAPSSEEKFAESRVLDALAAQRAVALFRTEARLHSEEARRTEKVLEKLQRSAMWLENENLIDSLMEPVQSELAEQLQLAKQAERMAMEKEDEFVTLRREAHAAVAKLMWREEQQYREEFQAALSFHGGVQAAEKVHCILAGFEERSSKEELHPMQPIPEGQEPNSPEYLSWLRQEAQKAISSDDADGSSSLSFTSLVKGLANDGSAGTATIAPLKGYERTIQKVQEKYSGDFSKVLDLVRGMVVFDSVPDLANALELLQQYDAEGEIRVYEERFD